MVGWQAMSKNHRHDLLNDGVVRLGEMWDVKLGNGAGIDRWVFPFEVFGKVESFFWWADILLVISG